MAETASTMYEKKVMRAIGEKKRSDVVKIISHPIKCLINRFF